MAELHLLVRENAPEPHGIWSHVQRHAGKKNPDLECLHCQQFREKLFFQILNDVECDSKAVKKICKTNI